MRKATRFLSLTLAMCLAFGQTGLAQFSATLDIPAGSAYVTDGVRERFRPPHLRSIQFDSSGQYFRIFLDKGDAKNFTGLEAVPQTRVLLDYFLIGLALPDKAFWVNLRPDSPENVIDRDLARTDVGRIMLEADVQLKKDLALMTSPNTPEGRKYWDKLYLKAEELLGSENVTIPTLSRPWIVPGDIIVRESTGKGYIYKATLKVMLEQDHLKGSAQYSFSDERLKALNEYASQLLKEHVIPRLTREVNTAKRYASLRQVYYSLILARWFKARFAGSHAMYASRIDTKDLSGLESSVPWSTVTFYDAYRKSFREGEYDIRENVGTRVRSYCSGGIELASVSFPAVPAGTIREKVDGGTIVRSVRGVGADAGLTDALLGAEIDSAGNLATMSAVVADASSDMLRDGGSARASMGGERDITAPTGTLIGMGMDGSGVMTGAGLSRDGGFGRRHEIGEAVGSHGHRINKGASRGRSAREVIVVDFERDAALRDFYADVRRGFEEKIRQGLSGTDKGRIVRAIFELISQRVSFDDAAADALAERYMNREVLIGEAAITPGVGVCRHMGIIAAAVLERFIEDGILAGQVYYCRGPGHGWAVYRTSGGDFFVLDVAQKYFGPMEGRSFYSSEGYRMYADYLPAAVRHSPAPVRLMPQQLVPRLMMTLPMVNEEEDRRLPQRREAALEHAGNFRELDAALDDMVLQGSRGLFTARQLRDMVAQAREAFRKGVPLEEALLHVTRAGGLRDKMRQLLRDVNSAESFEDLYATLNALGGLQGSRMFYDAAQLRSLIERARSEMSRGVSIDVALSTVTSTDGLREKVRSLLSDVSRAGNLEELFNLLDSLGGLTGSDGRWYSAASLKRAILAVRTLVRQGGFEESYFDTVTRANGLRDTVIDIVRMENAAMAKFRRGASVVLKKTAMKAPSSVAVGAELRGTLNADIIEGREVRLSAGSTSTVASVTVVDVNTLRIETATSTYEARLADGGAAQEKRTRELGGIDFRTLPIAVELVDPSAFIITPDRVSRLSIMDLGAESAKLLKAIRGGISPSNERLKEFVLACYVTGRLEAEMDKVLGCIAGALRLEEERGVETDSSLRDILVFVESSAGTLPEPKSFSLLSF